MGSTFTDLLVYGPVLVASGYSVKKGDLKRGHIDWSYIEAQYASAGTRVETPDSSKVTSATSVNSFSTSTGNSGIVSAADITTLRNLSTSYQSYISSWL